MFLLRQYINSHHSCQTRRERRYVRSLCMINPILVKGRAADLILLIPQCFDGMQTGCPHRRIDAEEQPYRRAEADGHQYGLCRNQRV